MKWKTHQAIAITTWTLTGFLGSIVGLFVVMVTSTLPDIDSMLGMKHRAFTHSLLCLGIIVFIAWFIYSPFVIPIIIGYGSHIASDSFTKMGVQLLYPNKKMCGFRRIKTGSSEDLFICLVCVGYLFYRYWA